MIAGDDRGREGLVLKVDPARNMAIVEGINFVKRHQKGTQKAPQGGIVEKEAPVHMSNLMAICGKCAAGVKTRTITQIDGSKMRACRKCGEIIAGSKT